jgi:hypothetical protein
MKTHKKDEGLLIDIVSQVDIGAHQKLLLEIKELAEVWKIENERIRREFDKAIQNQLEQVKPLEVRKFTRERAARNEEASLRRELEEAQRGLSVLQAKQDEQERESAMLEAKLATFGQEQETPQQLTEAGVPSQPLPAPPVSQSGSLSQEVQLTALSERGKTLGQSLTAAGVSSPTHTQRRQEQPQVPEWTPKQWEEKFLITEELKSTIDIMERKMLYLNNLRANIPNLNDEEKVALANYLLKNSDHILRTERDPGWQKQKQSINTTSMARAQGVIFASINDPTQRRQLKFDPAQDATRWRAKPAYKEELENAQQKKNEDELNLHVIKKSWWRLGS